MYLMCILDRCRGACLTSVLLAGTFVARGQGVSPQGGEINLTGLRPGDQVLPAVALSPATRVIAFYNQGQGIYAADLNNNNTSASIFSVNKTAIGDQVRPAVAILRGGQTLFVWQSKTLGNADIFARFASGSTISSRTDVLVNSHVKDQQVDPVVTALLDGGAMVAWASYGQDGSGWGVYARKLTAAGAVTPSAEFMVNRNVSGSQRHPAICRLANGNVVIAWVSDIQRSVWSVDIYARIFSPTGSPITDEFRVNSSTNKCVTPALAPLANGGFTAVWAQHDPNPTNGMDIWARAFSANGSPSVAAFRVNDHQAGDQFQPRVASAPSGVLVVWDSLGQDGDRDGIFGRFLGGGAAVSGNEFQVNTTWMSQQLEPDVAWNGVDRFLVVWSSFTGLMQGQQICGFDLFGQVYVLK